MRAIHLNDHLNDIYEYSLRRQGQTRTRFLGLNPIYENVFRCVKKYLCVPIWPETADGDSSKYDHV